MIYIFEGYQNSASVVLDASTLSEAQISNSIQIEVLPKAEQEPGKVEVLKCSKSENKIWYEYEDIIPTEEQLLQEKIQELENALMEMSTLQAIKDAENEQAIMELTMMITMLGGM